MPPGPDDLLDSWKGIAAYLNRGVRTVRRWEREEGLPVHRQPHRKLGTVYAYKPEVEAWRVARARTTASGPPAHPAAVLSDKQPSIAVLPFTNLSADADNAYFADGLVDEVTAALSTVHALRVTSRTSAMTFRGSTKDVRTIAAELGVRYLLEGSVRRAGGQLRITAQLIDATTDDHVWANTYEGVVADVFAIQERLARVVVEALQIRLTADEERRLAERPIDNVHAYECYLRAREEGWRWRKDAIDHAVQLLRNGLDIIGDNARLYAALGLAHLQYREAGIDAGEGPLAAAEQAAAKVFELEGASPAGLLLRGWLHYAHGRIQDAAGDLCAALEFEPNNPDALLLLANCYLISGRASHARPLIVRLLAIDPLTPLTRCMPAWADVLDGRFAAAIDPYRQMFQMDPSNPMARLFYVWVLLLNGRGGEAGQAVAAFPPDVRLTVPARIASFLVHAHAGRRTEAEAVLPADLDAAAGGSDLFPRLIAQGFALAGRPDSALHWLTIAVERGFINYPFLAERDPFLVSLRDDARFVRLLETVNTRWRAFLVCGR